MAHLLAMILARVVFMIVAAFIFLLIITRVFAQESGDFLYVTDLEIDNVSVSTSTRMMPIPVNLLNYVNSLLIRGDGTDRIFTFANNATTSGFVQDMTANGANVWVFATSAPSTVVTQKMFHGGTDADQGFPLVGSNFDGTGGAVGGHYPLRATSTASIEINDLLDIRVDISAHVPCGTIISKTGTNIINPTGYGLYAIGQESRIVHTTVGGTQPNAAIFFEFTPLNFDVWICAVGTTQTSVDWTKSDTRGIELRDVVSNTTICEQDNFTPITLTGISTSLEQQILLNTPCLIRQNQHVRVFITAPNQRDSEDGFAGRTSTDSNFFIEWNSGCSGPCHIEGAGPIRDTGPDAVTVLWVRDSLLGTTTNARIGAMVDDTWSFDTNAFWDGQRITVQIDYTDPDFDVLIDSVVQFTITEAGGIATSTGDLEIGKGFNHGRLYNLEIDAGVTTVLDVDFDGDDINQTRVGNSSNSFQWLGSIQDESGSNNDLEYILTFDDTNINREVSGFMDNPTPTPTVGEIGTSTALIGAPSLGVFFTPIPTPEGGLIMGNLKTGAAASTLPVEAFWMILVTIILAVALGIVHRFFPNKPVFAALAIIGMAILSLSVGTEFAMWIVTLFAMWAFGSTTLFVLWSR